MKHGSLFSGIGGFDLAAEWMGWENVFHCEISEFPKKILKHYWPNAISYENIYDTDFTIHRGAIDVLSGGFPCQPFSTAGSRKGTDDSRYLWPEMLRAIREICPKWVVGENVYGLVNWNEGMVFNKVCSDLENEGYEVIPIVLPSASVNAPHKRDRILFIAHSNNSSTKYSIQTRGNLSSGKNESGIATNSNNSGTGICLPINEFRSKSYKARGRYSQPESWEDGINEYVANTNSTMLEHRNGEGENGWDKQKVGAKSFGSPRGWEAFPTKSPVCSRDDGFPTGLDNITFPKWRVESVKGYGNAVVPQLILQIFKTIQDYANKTNTKPK